MQDYHDVIQNFEIALLFSVFLLQFTYIVLKMLISQLLLLSRTISSYNAFQVLQQKQLRYLTF